MLAEIREMVRMLRAGIPCRRFRDFHLAKLNDGPQRMWRRVLMIAVGVLLVVLGFVLSIPPGMPGFLLWLPGLALIAAQARLVADLLDRIECRVRNGGMRKPKA